MVNNSAPDIPSKEPFFVLVHQLSVVMLPEEVFQITGYVLKIYEESMSYSKFKLEYFKFVVFGFSPCRRILNKNILILDSF